MYVSLILKCVGVLILVHSLPEVINVIFFQVAIDTSTPGIEWWVKASTYLLPYLLRIVFGFILLFLSDKMAKRLVGKIQEEKLSKQIESKDLMSVGIALLGLWLFVGSLPELFTVFQYRHERISASYIGTNPSNFYINNFGQIIYILKAIVGILLFFQSHRIAYYWNKRKLR